jgi:hypothetical protein
MPCICDKESAFPTKRLHASPAKESLHTLIENQSLPRGQMDASRVVAL